MLWHENPVVPRMDLPEAVFLVALPTSLFLIKVGDFQQDQARLD